MLILRRKVGQTVFVGEDIEVTLLKIDLDEIKLGFVAPQEKTILREELLRPQDKILSRKSLISDTSPQN